MVSRTFLAIIAMGSLLSPCGLGLSAEQPVRKKVVILPVSFPMAEFRARGQIEPMRDWTAAAETYLTSGLQDLLARNPSFEYVPAPPLSETELAMVREHVSLCRVIAEDAVAMLERGGDAWKDKLKNFDYSVGKGLAFLTERTGADHALCLTGSKLQSTGNRKAMAFLGILGGVPLGMGDAQASLALVELASGNIVWLERSKTVTDDVRTSAGAAEVARELVSRYPASLVLQR